MIIDKPSVLREAVFKYGAYPTHQEAEQILRGEIASFLDVYSKKMEELTSEEWERLKKENKLSVVNASSL
jgi:hypothetical protein